MPRTTLIDAIRRDILACVAESGTTVAVATAQIAAGRGRRRRRCGDSPSSARSTEVIVFQVGADLLDEAATRSGSARSKT